MTTNEEFIAKQIKLCEPNDKTSLDDLEIELRDNEFDEWLGALRRVREQLSDATARLARVEALANSYQARGLDNVNRSSVSVNIFDAVRGEP